MPPTITIRSLPKKKERPSSRYSESSDEGSNIQPPCTKNMLVKTQSLDIKMLSSIESDGENDDQSSVNLQKNLERTALGNSAERRDSAAMSKDVSSAEDETSNPFSNKYPLSQQVFELEKRAQELQDNSEFWKKKSLELTLSLEGLTKLVKIERSDHEANRKSFKAANDALTKQLEEEKDKVKELQAKNESLAADLATLSGEKAILAKMLEEKTYESWIFRCAVAVVYKATPSARERVSMRQLICDVLTRLRDNYQRDRATQEDTGAQDQNSGNNSNQVSEQAAESLPQREESLLIAGTGKVDSDSEDMPLRDRKPLQKSQKRPRVTKGKRDRTSDDDSEEDQPLFHVLKKKAKKLKIMPSRKESASSG